MEMKMYIKISLGVTKFWSMTRELLVKKFLEENQVHKNAFVSQMYFSYTLLLESSFI